MAIKFPTLPQEIPFSVVLSGGMRISFALPQFGQVSDEKDGSIVVGKLVFFFDTLLLHSSSLDILEISCGLTRVHIGLHYLVKIFHRISLSTPSMARGG
jgi:hypothetical protein